MADKNYYKVAEVAKHFDIPQSTVYDWIRRGKLQALRLGCRYRVSREALDAFTAESRVEAEAPAQHTPTSEQKRKHETLWDTYFR